MFRKYAKSKVEKVLEYKDFNSLIKVAGKDVQERLFNKIASIPLIKTDPTNFIYVRNRSISALETWGPNQNWDAFPSKELKTKYSTFLNCPVDVDHIHEKEDDVIGIVLDSTYIPKMIYRPSAPSLLPFPEEIKDEDLFATGKLREGDRVIGDYIENLLAIDKKRAELKIPGLVHGILAGQIHDTSMGCSVEKSQCSVCGNIATQPEEFCIHVLTGKGRKFSVKNERNELIEKIAYEINNGIDFFEDSIIVSDDFAKIAGISAEAGGEGADSRAKILERLGSKQPSLSDFVKKSYFFLNPSQDFYITVGEKPASVEKGEAEWEKEMEKIMEENKKNLSLDNDKKISYYDLYQIGYKNLSKQGKVENFIDEVTGKISDSNGLLNAASKLKLKIFYKEFLKKSLKEDLIAIIRGILKDAPKTDYDTIQARVQKLGYKQEDIEEMLLFEAHFGKVNDEIKKSLVKKRSISLGLGELGNLIDRNADAISSDKNDQTDHIAAPLDDDRKITSSNNMVEDNIEDHKNRRQMEKLAPEEIINEIKNMLKTSESSDKLKDEKTVHQGTGMESVAEDNILNKDESGIEKHKNKNVADYGDHKPIKGDQKYYTENDGKVKEIKSLLKTSTLIPSVPELKDLFEQVNKDCNMTGESVVPLNDIEYYTTQIENIYGLDNNTSKSLATQLAEMSKISRINSETDIKREEQEEKQKNFAFDNAQKILDKDLSEGNSDKLKIEDKIKETKSMLKDSATPKKLETEDENKNELDKMEEIGEDADAELLELDKFELPEEEKLLPKTPIENSQKWRTYTRPVPQEGGEKTLGELEELWDSSPFDISSPITELIENYGKDYKVKMFFLKPEKGWFEDPEGKIKNEKGEDKIEFWNYPQHKKDYYDKPLSFEKEEKRTATLLKIFKEKKTALVDYGDNNLKEVPMTALEVDSAIITDEIPEGSQVEIKKDESSVGNGTVKDISTMVMPDGKETRIVETNEGKSYSAEDYDISKISQLGDLGLGPQEDIKISVAKELEDLEFDKDFSIKLDKEELKKAFQEEEVPIDLSSVGKLFEEEKEELIKESKLEKIDLFDESLSIEKDEPNYMKQIKHNLKMKELDNGGGRFVSKGNKSTHLGDDDFWN